MLSNDPDEGNEENQSYHPCIGDLVMKGHAEGNVAGCGVVLDVFENQVGDRVYFIQTNKALIMLKPGERITQKELDMMGYHPATKEEWHDDLRTVEEWYEGEKAKLYEVIQPFLE